MKPALLAVALLSGGLGCAIHTADVPRPVVAEAASIERARGSVRALMDAQGIPGLSITVSDTRGILWQEGFGLADIEAGRRVSSTTQFRVGSVSKLITATALMRLAQKGRLRLDTRVSDCLDGLPQELGAITLRQLAGHLGGIRHYRGNEFLSTTHYARLQDALAIFAGDPLIAPPGTRYAYSSYGYNLLGAAMEAKLQTPFHDILLNSVLKPLGMTATSPDIGASSGRAQGYSVATAGASRAPKDDLSGRLPSGGYLMTTGDMARLGRSILAPGFLTTASLSIMLTPQRLASNAATSVGIGWRIGVDASGRAYAHHGGSSNGGGAFLLVYPGHRLVVAMASNAFTSWGEKDTLAVANEFLKAPL